MDPIKVVSLYCFKELDSVNRKRQNVLRFCQDSGVKGLIILAQEGINGTIAGSIKKVDLTIKYFMNEFNCDELNLKQSFSSKNPFGRIKVRIKKEIVTSGMSELSAHDQAGRYVEPSEWNELILDKNVVTIDTRNDYEVSIGTFQGAINPSTDNFADFPNWWRENRQKYEGKSIAMFCTGGIRCEKATKFLLKEGVKNVYHLRGGILNYLENYTGANCQWKGECFVFDQRVSVGQNLEEGSCNLCFACRHPLRPNELYSSYYEEGVSCHRCYKETSESRKEGFRERQRQIRLSDQRGEKHLKYF